MKTELKAKFLQHILNKKNENEGFTLIELLVVIIIIGILSAIALPSFLSQANKGKQSEAKQYVGTMNRGQQAYYLQEGKFTTDLDTLGVGIKSQTTNYVYSIAQVLANTVVLNNAVSNGSDKLYDYVGAVSSSEDVATSQAKTLAIFCQSNTTAGSAATTTTVSAADGPACPANYTAISK
ncbi:type IV pilin-like G/H family protein [Nostoc sp.]|uniref:type IV pilin-like G/H family protein n=1 Tax=Nostoc sp. TaxID=1180 RepID=UPI002FF61800